MKQNAVQNKRYYHGDFRSATTAPEVDTRARNYDLFVQQKTLGAAMVHGLGTGTPRARAQL